MRPVQARYPSILADPRAGRAQVVLQTCAMARSTRVELVAVLVVWVLPLLLVAALLAIAGLPEVALAVLAVEVAVGLVVARARRAPSAPGGEPAQRPWLVPLVMVLVLLALAGVGLVGSRLG